MKVKVIFLILILTALLFEGCTIKREYIISSKKEKKEVSKKVVNPPDSLVIRIKVKNGEIIDNFIVNDYGNYYELVDKGKIFDEYVFIFASKKYPGYYWEARTKGYKNGIYNITARRIDPATNCSPPYLIKIIYKISNYHIIDEAFKDLLCDYGEFEKYEDKKDDQFVYIFYINKNYPKYLWVGKLPRGVKDGTFEVNHIRIKREGF